MKTRTGRSLGVVVALLTVFLLLFTACAEETPYSETTKPPPKNTTTVKSRKVLKNMPGGEGDQHILIRICWHGKHTGCASYRPSKVENCTLDAPWSSCKH